MTNHAKVLRLAKGYRKAANSVFRVANQAVHRAQVNQYKDRRHKKRSFRTLWIARINAALQYYGINYSRFMGYYAQTGIALDRKMLAELAVAEPVSFRAVTTYVLEEFKAEEDARRQRVIDEENRWVTRDTLTDTQREMTESFVGYLEDKQQQQQKE